VCVGAPGHDGLRQPVKRQETLPLYHLAEELVPSVTVNAGAGPTQKNQRCWLAGVTTMAVGSPAAWLSYSSCLPFSKPSSLSLPCYTSYGSFPIGRATIISTSTTLPRTSGSPPPSWSGWCTNSNLIKIIFFIICTRYQTKIRREKEKGC
jgi:hypothetical protein